MKVFLSCDIEGVTGIVHWDETQNTGPFAEQMTREVAAACRAAVAAGCTDLLVKDAHATARNINPQALPETARIFRGWSRNPYCMMAGIDEGFDVALFTGYHGAAGMDENPLAHTMNGQNVTVRLNDDLCSEWLINAYAAAYCGTAVSFISGDVGICAQAKRYQPNIVTVPVNRGVGSGTIAIHPNAAIRLIEEGVANALALPKAHMALRLPNRFKLEIQYREHASAYRNGFYPGAVQADTHTVRYEADDYMDVLKFMLFCL